MHCLPCDAVSNLRDLLTIMSICERYGLTGAATAAVRHLGNTDSVAQGELQHSVLQLGIVGVGTSHGDGISSAFQLKGSKLRSELGLDSDCWRTWAVLCRRLATG